MPYRAYLLDYYMFETHPQAAMAKPPFSTPETADWSWVSQSLDTPWFRLICCHRDGTDEDWREIIRFVGYAPLVLAYLDSVDSQHYVKEALIAVPAWLSGLDHCQFMRLQKIAMYQPACGFAPHFAYEVEGGARYPLEVNWNRVGVEVLYDAGKDKRGG
ncbi:hypothetical protein PsasTeo6_21952 [Pseudomonas asiatica]|nr:hypothetical protein PsasTeo6_21952 [Pseudomonas asiatica]